MFLRVLDALLGPPYHIHIVQSVTPKQTPCRPIPSAFERSFPARDWQDDSKWEFWSQYMRPPHGSTVLCLLRGRTSLNIWNWESVLDPTNLNKAIVREPYHFKTLEDIAHLLADVMYYDWVCSCKKGYWYQELDEASSFLTTFNTELGRFRYTVMLFGATVAGDVFQHKLDQLLWPPE